MQARDLSAEAIEFGTSFQAIEQLEKLYDLGRPPLAGATFSTNLNAQKAALLQGARKWATNAEDAARLTEGYLKVAESAFSAKEYNDALTAAEQAAKTARDPALASRAKQLAQEIPLLKAEQEGVGKAELALAVNADDPESNLTLGRYLCFVRGEWDRGLACLMKGADIGLRDLAKKELEKGPSAEALADLAESWWNLAQKEKNPIHKARYHDRVAQLFEQALAEAGGLARVKIEKRMAQLGHKRGAVDLLKLIDCERDKVNGNWTSAGGFLKCSAPTLADSGRIEIPYAPGDSEYDLTIVGERIEGSGSLNLGIATGERQFFVIPNYGGGDVGGIDNIDGKSAPENESTFQAKLISNNKPFTAIVSVRRGGVALSVDGKKVMDWKGDASRLSLDSGWAVRHNGTLFIAVHAATYRFSKATFNPISGAGRRLR